MQTVECWLNYNLKALIMLQNDKSQTFFPPWTKSLRLCAARRMREIEGNGKKKQIPIEYLLGTAWLPPFIAAIPERELLLSLHICFFSHFNFDFIVHAFSLSPSLLSATTAAPSLYILKMRWEGEDGGGVAGDGWVGGGEGLICISTPM